MKVGDELAVRFGQKLVTVKIERLQETVRKEDAAAMYSVVKEEKVES